MNVSGRTRVFALLGHPVAHSRSPAIYNPLFEEHGVDAVYVALDVDPARAGEVGGLVRTLGFAGVNLTVPFKAEVLGALDRVDPLAAALGAVNVVVRQPGGLHGYNTDASGFCRALAARFGEVAPGARVGVLGAGGAGRAVGIGLAAAGAAEVVWWNRSAARADEAVLRGRSVAPRCRFSAEPLDAARFAARAGALDLVVQCTSGDGIAQVAAFDVQRLPAHAIWCDVNYWMDDPPLLAACRARGLRVQDGLEMLVYQAAEAFELFTGITPDPLTILRRLG